MKTLILSCSLAAGAVLAGCSDKPEPAPAGNTMTPPPGSTNANAASPMMNMPTMAGCADKDASHMVTGDTPVYVGPPGQGMPPTALVKAGTKVLVMTPGSEYCKCMVADGKTVYLKTSMLKPTTN